ncbi:MAG: BCCT family transporter [Oceanicaulis sp.]|nr:BCCT family transporter [Oceanicaulis sp.]
MTDLLARAWRGTRLGVFFATAGFCLGFCALAVFDLSALSNWVDAGSSLVARGFGLYWQILLPAIFLIALAIALSPAGKIRLGGRDTPEFPYFQWSAMIACTLLGAGGVFWAAAEPLAHFLTPPPNADVSASAQAAVDVALAQSFLHWGFPRLGEPRRAERDPSDVLRASQGLAVGAADAALPGIGPQTHRRPAGRGGRHLRAHRRHRGHRRADRLSGASGQRRSVQSVRLSRRFADPDRRDHRPGVNLHHLRPDGPVARHPDPQPIQHHPDRPLAGLHSGGGPDRLHHPALPVGDGALPAELLPHRPATRRGGPVWRERLAERLDPVLLGLVHRLWADDGDLHRAHLARPLDPLDHPDPVGGRPSGHPFLVHHSGRQRAGVRTGGAGIGVRRV